MQLRGLCRLGTEVLRAENVEQRLDKGWPVCLGPKALWATEPAALAAAGHQTSQRKGRKVTREAQEAGGWHHSVQGQR